MTYAPTLPPPDEVTPADAIEYLKKFAISVAQDLGVESKDLGIWGPVIALYVLEREILSWASFTDREPADG